MHSSNGHQFGRKTATSTPAPSSITAIATPATVDRRALTNASRATARRHWKLSDSSYVRAPVLIADKGYAHATPPDEPYAPEDSDTSGRSPEG